MGGGGWVLEQQVAELGLEAAPMWRTGVSEAGLSGAPGECLGLGLEASGCPSSLAADFRTPNMAWKRGHEEWDNTHMGTVKIMRRVS